MSNVHPKFDINTSRCTNCLAAVIVRNAKGEALPSECRRHAPRPTMDQRIDRSEDGWNDEPYATLQSNFRSGQCWWPEIDPHDDEYCLEWIPIPSDPTA